jgi:bifunctional DNA-binding transcriptional regulator/antitoxin component of YhaV-PrlF toxin-antitoxin module
MQTVIATAVREKRQTTLPAEVCDPAGIEPGDQIAWRFEAGEIRGRKLVLEAAAVRTVKPQIYKGILIMPGEVDLDKLAEEVQAARQERDEDLLG